MKIGYACLALGTDARTNHSFVLRNFSPKRCQEAIADNLADLGRLLDYNQANGILLFRISSDIIPFASHPEMTCSWEDIFQAELAAIGDRIRRCGMRVSMHPGQYTVLNSPDPQVAENARRDLAYHARFLDLLGVGRECKIVLHGGGVYGNRPEAMERFFRTCRQLEPNILQRLVLENDDRSFPIDDILTLSARLQLPVVFDNLHHQLKPPAQPTPLGEILTAVRATWRPEDGPMKLHYSEAAEGKKNGSHSKTVVVERFLQYLANVAAFQPDIMLEVKDKDLSAIKVVTALKEKVTPAEKSRLWARYKYTVMESSYARYKECSRVINSPQPVRDFFRLLDQGLLQERNPGSFINAAQHVWGYYKDRVTPAERQRFTELCAQPDQLDAVKPFLQRMAKKYPHPYIDQSHYFSY